MKLKQIPENREIGYSHKLVVCENGHLNKSNFQIQFNLYQNYIPDLFKYLKIIPNSLWKVKDTR